MLKFVFRKNKCQHKQHLLYFSCPINSFLQNVYIVPSGRGIPLPFPNLTTNKGVSINATLRETVKAHQIEVRFIASS